MLPVTGSTSQGLNVAVVGFLNPSDTAEIWAVGLVDNLIEENSKNQTMNTENRPRVTSRIVIPGANCEEPYLSVQRPIDLEDSVGQNGFDTPSVADCCSQLLIRWTLIRKPGSVGMSNVAVPNVSRQKCLRQDL